MYSREAGYYEFMLSEALSFGTAVTCWSLGLMIVIKVMINEVNSVSYTAGALQFWYYSEGYEFLPMVYEFLVEAMSLELRLWAFSPCYEFLTKVNTI